MMPTEIHPDAAPPSAAAPRERPPTLVIAAFYLWWPLIIGQSVILAYLALTLVEAARVGGPAWDVLFVDPPTVVPLLLLITLEVAFALTMRGGSRVARAVLLALAAVTIAFAFLVGIPDHGTRTPVVQTTAEVLAASVPVDLSLVLKVLAAIALVASVLPFVPPANRYFWRPPYAPTPDVEDGSPAQGTMPRPRRRMPWQVLVAFILWWPIIVIEGLVLFAVGSQMAYYVGLGMGSVITVLFAVGVALPLLGIIAAEVTLVLFLRRGSRVARRWLMCLAIPTALLVIWPAAAVAIAAIMPREEGLGGGWIAVQISTIGGIIAALVIAASILPYLRPGRRFFSDESGADDSGVTSLAGPTVQATPAAEPPGPDSAEAVTGDPPAALQTDADPISAD
ncbi:hypothetical protein SAMN04487846_1412 [Microbacterium sp. cf046]|uniref:hypothetical protein n=1 Tax=Microbacterium sp. cf046 TaxID=1761803 RepID=UPI0008DEDF8C|nr:hypothetical protein [Microbacterium sp. cf046]SFS00821.1 hypothetical protein SAMN04487846_1412 [Microbacterium sp. cf046]